MIHGKTNVPSGLAEKLLKTVTTQITLNAPVPLAGEQSWQAVDESFHGFCSFMITLTMVNVIMKAVMATLNGFPAAISLSTNSLIARL